jgi:hypothetical protein
MMVGGSKARIFVSAVIISVVLAGCQNPNDIAKKLGAPPDSAVALRALETRRFNTLDEPSLLSATTQTLQDLGYTLTESSSDVGVIVGSKQRDAEETGQVAAQIGLTILFAAMGTYYQPLWDKEQSINVTVVATPIENSKQIEIRVSFDRVMTNNQGQKWRAELIMDPEIYKQFFDKLSEGTFLEAQAI